nr:hypothetical protein [Tanacetum cinerariifolium]
MGLVSHPKYGHNGRVILAKDRREMLEEVMRKDGEINIQPGAYRKKFPAQFRFTRVWDCSPLAEHEFRDAIKDNYYSMKKFHFGLNQDQVDKLMMLFRSKKISKNQERNVWRRGDKLAEGHARFGGDLRRTIVVRAVSKEDDRINLNDEKIVEVDKRDRFKKNHLRENDDFGDSGSRKKLPGNHLDHSLVGLKREAEVGSLYMVNENKGHEFNNNHREFRGLTDEDNFSMMEKTKVKNDIEDGYIPLYTPE